MEVGDFVLGWFHYRLVFLNKLKHVGLCVPTFFANILSYTILLLPRKSNSSVTKQNTIMNKNSLKSFQHVSFLQSVWCYAALVWGSDVYRTRHGRKKRESWLARPELNQRSSFIFLITKKVHILLIENYDSALFPISCVYKLVFRLCEFELI